MNSSWKMSRGGKADTTAHWSSPPRRLVGLVAAAALALAGAVVIAPSASAASGPFVINGVVPDAGATELTDPFGNVKELGPKNSNATKIGVIHNAAVPMLDPTNPNAQVDLRRAWLTTAKDTNTQHDWLYFAWERDSNSGSGFIAYEFMKSPAPAACAYDTATEAQLIASCNPWKNRQAGDFIILWDQSGSSTQLSLRTWSGTAPNLTLGAPTTLNAAVSEAKFSPNGFFGEAAVDLTATVFAGQQGCVSFANTIPSTVTGNSDTADYKDTILKQAPPISNCASITIKKVTQNAPAGDTTPFAYTTVGSGLSGFSLTGGGEKTFNALSPGGYSVTETDPTAPWNFVSLVCTSTGTGTSTTIATRTANITLGNGGHAECTYTNHYTNSPSIVTSATGEVLVGSTISDTATLSGASSGATGTITFNLYDNDQCTGPAVFTDTATVNGNGQYTSDPYTTTAVDTYYWIASYGGDGNNAPVSGACKDAGEVSTVNPFAPAIVTHATESVTVGQSISDTATLSGATSDATGTITFNLYSDDECTTQIFTDSAAVDGNGDYTSDGYAPATVGDFYWIASYSGDAKNLPASGDCGDANEISTVIQRAPGIVTHATASITIGASISDTATLSGALAPTGTITFKLYSDDTCDTQVFTNTVAVNGNGDYTSANYTPIVVGTYYWIANYSGDANNAPAAGDCGDANEASVVNQASPAIVTNASASVTIDSAIHDTATLSGGVSPTGSITFNLYDNDQCTGPAVFTDSKTVNGNGDYTSANFTPTVVGTYYWIASYSGDTNNKEISGACGDPNESSVVNKAGASLTTAQMLRPQDSVDVSAAAGGVPTGDVTFKLFATSDCSGSPSYSETKPLAAGKAATNNTSFDIEAASASTYKWLVSYEGDAKHLAITGSCGDENFTLTIDNGGTVSSP